MRTTSDLRTAIKKGPCSSQTSSIQDNPWYATATLKKSPICGMHVVRTLEGHRAMVWCVAFSPDSQFLASGSAEERSGCIKVWDVATGREHRQLLGHERLVFGLAFHPNGRLLASASLDGSVCLWDVADGKSVGLLHQFDRAVYSVAFHPNGRWLAAASLDNRIALWDLTTMPNSPTPPKPISGRAHRRRLLWSASARTANCSPRGRNRD